ncbi:MAG: MMPL family transporter [Desulfomonilaceae bacterium]|nr:MMPL family transporter [Desulfomonilaceae bacterium]
MLKPTEKMMSDLLVNRRGLLVWLTVLVTAGLVCFIPDMTTDPTLKSGIDTDAPDYREYERFLKIFGSEEFILIAVRNTGPVDDPKVLKSLAAITEQLEGLDKVTDVVSLANFKMFGEKQGLFGSYDLVRTEGDSLKLADGAEVEKIRKALPVFDFLLSRDGKTFGLLVRLDDEWRFDIPVIEETVGRIGSIVRSHEADGSEYRIVGAPIVRQAIHKYNLQTAVLFGILCLTIATSVSFYIFKSLRVTLIAMTVMTMCVAWILAFMSITGIPLNSTTGLSFGLVLIVSVAAVIRITTHFNERYSQVHDRAEAARQALYVVLVPCFMCSTTTSVGFGSIMVSTIPMVFQLGLIMSLGVMMSFVLCVVLTPAFLTKMKPISPLSYERMSRDWTAKALAAIERAIVKYHRRCVVMGLVGALVMTAGIPFIHSDTQILRMLSDRTPEMKDIHFVEEHLTRIHSLELVIEAEPRIFRQPEAWKKVSAMQERLMALPEVVSIDSFLPLLEYLTEMLDSPESSKTELFSDPRMLTDLFALVSFSADARMLARRFLDEDFGILHLSVKIKNSPSVPIANTIEEVRSAAQSAMGHTGRVSVTGDIAVFAAQASGLVTSQLYSLILAFTAITALLMIHLRSVTLGLISLIPNLFPVVTILGVMGWLGISLDTVTVFCAAVALGLAVDDTVHFLKQLRNELKLRGHEQTFEQSVHRAYEITAKAMVSTSAVLFFGFVMLLLSPFRPVNSFGILSSVAILTALFGDVLFLPSLLLSSNFVRRLLMKGAAKREPA